ncbi:MAG TPA: hypothetical protein DCW90_11885 [Lachnospiraceae bacterium]|nr:hypothetical protein [Lachnospiraceae bacterium]
MTGCCMNNKFIITNAQEQAEVLLKMGYELLYTTECSWVFLNDISRSMKFDVANQSGVHFSDTLHL